MDQRFLVPHEVAKYDSKLDSIAGDFVKILSKKMDDRGKVPNLENLVYCFSTEGLPSLSLTHSLIIIFSYFDHDSSGVGAVLYDMRIGVLTEGVNKKGQDFLAVLQEVFHFSF